MQINLCAKMPVKLPHFLNIVKNSADEAEIDIFGDIGQSWFSDGFTKEQMKQTLNELGNVSKINVNISSFGGSLDDGLVIHDLLKNHPAQITTNVIGYTASAATIIAQAGDQRQISENALYLIHLPSMIAYGNINDMQLAVDDLSTMGDQIIDLYKKSTGQSRPTIKNLINENNGNGKWLTPEECKTYGLVDEIFTPGDKGIQNARKLMVNFSPEIQNAYKYPEIPMITNTKDKVGEGIFAEIRTMFNDILNAVKPSEKKTENAANPKCPDCSKPMNEVTSFQCEDCGSKASNAVLEKITAAEKVNTDIRNEYATLETETVTLRQTIADNATAIANHTQVITDLNTKIAGLEADLTAANKTNAKSTKPAGVEAQEEGMGKKISALTSQFAKDIATVTASMQERTADPEDLSRILENPETEGMTEEEIEALATSTNKK